MSRDWVPQKIDDLCLVTDYVANGSFARLKENVQYLDEPDFAMLVRYTDFAKGWNGKHKYVSEAAYHFLSKSSLRAGDLIMANVGEPGRAFLLPNLGMPTTLGPNSILIRAISGETSNDFLHYFFMSDSGRDLIDAISSGVAQKKFNKTAFRSLEIPLPPLKEQRRIVAILDEAFEGLARAKENAEVNLQSARELFESELDDCFQRRLANVDRRRFEEVTHDTLIGLVRSKKEQSPDKPFDYVKMHNIGNDDRYLGGVVDRVDCDEHEAEKYQLLCGDFLFNTRNSRELVGKSCVVEDELSTPSVFNNNIMRVRFGNGVLPRFVALAFRSREVKEQLEAMKSGTTSVVAIYHKALKKLRLPVPSVSQQQELVSRFEALADAQLAVARNYAAQIKDLNDLRQSLLQKAFAGELT